MAKRKEKINVNPKKKSSCSPNKINFYCENQVNSPHKKIQHCHSDNEKDSET